MALSTISGTTGITDATITSAKLADFAAAVDLNGVELILDADQDTSITADTDDRIDFKIAGVEHISISNSSGDTIIKPMVDAKDIVFQQYDGNKIFEINDGNFVAVSGAAAGPGEIRIYEDTDNGTHYTGFKAGNNTASVAYVLPTADGTDGFQLTTDGSGTLSWSSAGTTLANDGNNRVVTGTGSGLNGEANLTFDGSTLAVTGAITGSSDLTLQDDLILDSDSAVLSFGEDNEITVTHVADTGLNIKHTATGDDKPIIITLQTGETDIAANDVIGTINFQAPDEGTGTDAILVAAGISAISEGDFSSSANATKLSFKTAVSAAASETMSLTSNGDLFLAGGLIDLKNDGNAVSQIKFYCESSNAHAQTLIGAPHSEGATNVLTLPGTGGDARLVSTTSTATLTNKTLTTPVIAEIDSGSTITLDATTDIVLDADGGDIFFKDAGTTFGSATNTSGNLIIKSGTTTALTFSGANVTGAGTLQGTTITATTAFVPDAADGAALGTTSLEFSDLFLADGATIKFGNDQDVTVTHVADSGLNFKNANTGDDNGFVLTLEAGDTDIAVNDVIGAINFKAPDEGAGTDAILNVAGIEAVSEGDFSSSNNATKLSFKTAASEAATEKMSLSSAGILTVADDIIIGDGKTIGSASDPDAITIASGGGVTFTQTPVFPDGSLALADLDIDGGTDIGADIVDADLFIIDDGAGGTNRKTTASRVKTYIGAATTIGALTDVTMDKASVGAGGGNFLYSILIDPASDGSAPDLDAVTGNANNNYGIGKDTFSALTTGSANVAIGEGAGKALTTGYSNVIIGGDAGDAMTEGLENVCVGVGAGSAITTGDYNVCMGRNALDANTTGDYNTAIGKDALGWLDGSNSTALGWQAGGSSAGASSLYLGYQAYGSGNSDEIILTGSGNPVSAGSDAFTFGKNGNRVYNQFNSNNNWTHSSDERMKKNIQNETLGLSFINRLRPVTYNFRLPSEYPEDFPYYDAENKNPKTDQLQHGILAQEVKAAMTAEGNDTFNGYQLANDGVHSVSESNFVYPMIKAMQELSAKVDALETENTALKARVKTLEDA